MCNISDKWIKICKQIEYVQKKQKKKQMVDRKWEVVRGKLKGLMLRKVWVVCEHSDRSSVGHQPGSNHSTNNNTAFK